MSLTPEELTRQINEARAKQDQNPDPRAPKIGEQNGAATGKALRAASELVAALIVGGFLGFWVDKWLGTMPLFLILFFFLGFAAGFMNIYRTQMGQDFSGKSLKAAAGDGQKKTDKEEQ
ncbi:MAG: AtpZ/AtpI family protein [Micavibrio sp.]|nr:AtpZ/AtpI family protein [Micavibrio sp.]